MNGRFEWKQAFVTGNEQVDNEHKQLFHQVNEIYEMFSDTKKYHDQISQAIKHLEFSIIKHFETENKLFEKYDIAGKEKHIQEHNEIKKSILKIKDYDLPCVITAMLICDIIINYFLEHFLLYDKKMILELNKKLLNNK